MNARTLAADVSLGLEAAGVRDSRFEAELLVREAGGLSRAAFFSDTAIDAGARERLAALVERRQQREPAAYLRGYREFYGIDIRVGPGVLIPRPETELLVDIALGAVNEWPGARVVDVGTGSGCVAAAIARHASDARVVATDMSPVALAIAKRNFEILGAKADLVRCHLMSTIDAADIVVANLPYIPTAVIETLEPEVRDWEPRDALDGGMDGLRFIRALVDDCARRVHPRLLALEVMAGQAHDVAAYAAASGATSQVRPDLAGIERVVAVSWE